MSECTVVLFSVAGSVCARLLPPPLDLTACMGVGPGEALQKRKGQVEEDMGGRGL